MKKISDLVNENYIKKILDSALFKGYNNSNRQFANEINLTIKSFSSNEIIVQEYDRFNGIGMIIEGVVFVTKEDISGNRNIIGELHDGDLFGEVGAFADMKIYPATVISKQDSIVAFISKETIISNAVLTNNMLFILSERLLKLNKKLDYNSIKGLDKKLAKYILDMANQQKTNEITLSVNREQLADFLGVTRPSLSRQLADFKNAGFIEFKKNKIKVLDSEDLKEV